MRILLVLDANQLPVGDPRHVGYGGIEAVVWFLAEALVAHGHQVAVMAAVGSTAPSGASCLIHRSITPPSTIHHWIAQADIVHCHDWGRMAQQWAPHFPRTPFITTWHGPAAGAPGTFPPNVTVTGVSRWHAGQIARTHTYPVHTITNGINLDAYPLYIGPRSPAALFLARRVPEKGLHLAVEASIQSGRPLWVAGPTDARFHGGRDYMRQMKRQMRRTPKGSWDEGEARGARKVRLLQHARVTVVPQHTFDEPFGLWAVESLACGTPVIGWRRGAIPDVIGHAGVAVESMPQLVEAMRHPPIISPMTCRDQAARWNADDMAREAERVYRQSV